MTRIGSSPPKYNTIQQKQEVSKPKLEAKPTPSEAPKTEAPRHLPTGPSTNPAQPNNGAPSASLQQALFQRVAGFESDIVGSGSGATPVSNPAGNEPQAWNNTCGANTLMTMEAAVDQGRAGELSALDGEDRAAMEGAVLVSSGSFGTSHIQPRPGGSTEGWGVFEMQRQISDRFVGDAQVHNASSRDDAVDHMVEVLEDGRPVAMAMDGHWMTATEIREGEDGNEILIHDSWTGDSVWVPESDLRQPGDHWINEHLPDAPFPGRIISLVSPETPQLDPNSDFRAAESDNLGAVEQRYNAVNNDGG